MPFTASHPAAVLPFLHAFAPTGAASALVIGSMTPDIAYFVPGPDTRHESHMLRGLTSFCLPAGLIGVVTWEWFLRRPMTALLPDALRSRLPEHPPFLPLWRPTVLLPVLAAILIGALTHQIWDSFTHANGVIVDLMPASREKVVTVGGLTIRVYKVFQHASTLLGAALLARAVRDWMRATPPATPPAAALDGRLRQGTLGVLVLLPTLLALHAGWSAELPEAWLHATQVFLGRGVIAFGQTLAISSVAWAAAWWTLKALRREAAAG